MNQEFRLRVGIVGFNGNFGRHACVLLERFVKNVEIVGFEPSLSDVSYTLEDVCACDAIILAVPPRAYEQVIKEIAPIIRRDNPKAIIVDIATVKEHPLDLLKRYARDLSWLSTHPNGGPGGYAKKGGNVEGEQIAFVGSNNVADSVLSAIRAYVQGCGFVVVDMSAEEHDQISAQSLYLAHRTAQILGEAGAKRVAFSTASFNALMDALEMVINDKKLFEDVRRYNRFCREMDILLDQAEARVLRPRKTPLPPLKAPYAAD